VQVSFDLTAADLEAWGDFSVRHNAVARRQMFATSLLVAVCVGLLGGIAVGRSPAGTTIAVLLAALTFVAAPWVVRGSSRRTTRALYSHGRNVGMLGPRTVRLDADGVHVEMDGGRESRYWWAVEDVTTSPDHVYIYVTSISAHIVPRRAFATRDDADRFYQEARRRHALAHGRV
jgi:hypothetical protein